PGREHAIDARRRRPVMSTGRQRYVERRAPRPLARRLERDDLGVRPAPALVPALPYDLAVAHEDRADDGVRMGRPAPSLSELERSFETHASACTSRRSARGRSSRPNIAEPAPS